MIRFCHTSWANFRLVLKINLDSLDVKIIRPRLYHKAQQKRCHLRWVKISLDMLNKDHKTQ